MAKRGTAPSDNGNGLKLVWSLIDPSREAAHGVSMVEIAALRERIAAQDAKIASQLEYISVLRQAGRHQVADLAEDTLFAMRKTAEIMRDRLWIMENARG